MGLQPRFRRIFTEFGDSYLRAILMLALNVPILGLLLLAGLRGADRPGIATAYFILVLLGYYALIPLVGITLAFSLSLFVRRLALAASGLVLAFFVYFLAVDQIVYGVFKFHLDGFWLTTILTDFNTMGVPGSVVAFALILLAVCVAVQCGLLWIARRSRRPGRVASAFVTAVFGAFVLSQAIHIVAYERSDSRITALTPRLPLYYPITWHRQAERYGSLVSWAMGPAKAPATRDPQGFRYPLRPFTFGPPSGGHPPNIVILLLESWRFDAMNAAVTPCIDSLAARSSNFVRHFSSGNSTPTGVFGLFYGIHPTYWDAIKAQGATRGGPVLLDVLRSSGYALGIYASHFERHKIAETLFRGIAVHDTFAGTTPDERDADMTRQLESFVRDASRRRQPFMAFAFYKSTHYSYYYPQGSARFQPHRKLNIGMAGDPSKLESYLNDYRNSVAYADQLVGDVVRTLEAEGLMSNTIIVVTSDHGEEFNDNGAGYWGHASNFTEYQTHVPMVIYVPGHAPRRVTALTTHVDIPTTLIQEVCRPEQDERMYSNGTNLFRALPRERPLVVSSYVNHAFILGDDVYSIFPMYVQQYKLDNVRAHADRPRPDESRAAMEEITRFRGGRSVVAEATARRDAAAAARRGAGTRLSSAYP